MSKKFIILSLFIPASIFCLVSCTHQPFPVPVGGADTTYGNFPPEVGKIMVSKCANGCHDPANAGSSANLMLDTWDHMLNGANNGAVVVAYSPEYSSLLYFINIDSSLGPVSKPTMPYNENPPYNRPALTKEEYNTLKTWIANGAPDRNGNIPFASNASTRQKIYMTMQGCNLLGVIDAEKKVVMRYIKTGDANNSLPHAVHVSWDGQYAYVSFASGNIFQKINTTTDQVVGSIDLNQNPGAGNPAGFFWNAFNISQDNSTIAVSTLDNAGKLVVFNANTMSNAVAWAANLHNLHGVWGNNAFDTIYVTSQYGNTVYKIADDGSTTSVSLNGNPVSYTSDSGSGHSVPDPHDIIMLPGDDSKYFITGQNSNQVFLMDAHLDKPIGAPIPVGIKPQEFAISKKRHLLFLTCMEDASLTLPSGAWKGSVYAIDYTNPQATPTRIDGTFYQPHGITVDDQNNTLYIPSRNVNPNGPAPHHTSSCGGRNGFYQVYDLNTLKPLNNDRKYEVTPDPYSCDVRFK